MKDYNAIEGMITESKSILQNRLYVAYDRGYEHGLKDNSEEAYQRGLNDAWECARKIVNAYTHANVENPNGLHKVFGDYLTAYTFDMSPAEAISKIRQYEEQKKAEQEEVKIGDEVEYIVEPETKGVIIRFCSNGITFIDADGLNYTIDKGYVKKTGRHFDQIAEVLKQLQEGEE